VSATHIDRRWTGPDFAHAVRPSRTALSTATVDKPIATIAAAPGA
jgi:hypothetical protein